MNTSHSRLLLVDDDPSQLKLMKLTLEGHGYTVNTAKDGQEALEILQLNPPDGVISDVLMPRMDGFQLCYALRKDEHFSNLPIVLLSSTFTEPEDDQLAKSVGANALVSRTSDVQCLVRQAVEGLKTTPQNMKSDRTWPLEDYQKRVSHQLNRQAGHALACEQKADCLDAKLNEFGCVLGEAQDRLHQIEENLRDVFFIVGDGGRTMHYVSPGYARIWGRTCQSLYDNPLSWIDAIHPADRPAIEQWLGEIKDGDSREYRITAQDGKIRWIRARLFKVHNPKNGIPRWVGSAEDFTESRQLADQFRQAQKMEAVGQLAGGVAHDFNNLLTAITAFAGFVGQTLPKEGQVRDDLNEVFKAAQRAANLTQQLLTFSRRQVVNPRIVDLNELVTDTHKMIRRIIGENIEVVIRAGTDAGLVKADPGSIEQVLMNLAINARDAMPKGGKLVIETAKVSEKDETIDMPLGDYVQLTVSDNGTGMTEEVRSRLFEPFFTTKEVGKGTGLGLATCFGIVKQSGGFIKVRTKPGYGTSFIIYFPQVQQETEPVEEVREEAASASSKASGIILLAEDEAAVRASTERILRAAGYQVLTASSGLDALRIVRDIPGKKIDLLLTDVIMPKMSGHQLVNHLRPEYPGMKVLYMSGYTHDVIDPNGAPEPGTQLLQKPFTAQTLMTKIQEVLNP